MMFPRKIAEKTLTSTIPKMSPRRAAEEILTKKKKERKETPQFRKLDDVNIEKDTKIFIIIK